MKLACAAAAALMLVGCATIDTASGPPSAFPRLKERIVKVSFNETQRICRAGALVQAVACADLNFDKGVCTIYTSTEDAHVLAHERLHCQGYDHPGDSTVRDHWVSWRAANTVAQQASPLATR